MIQDSQSESIPVLQKLVVNLIRQRESLTSELDELGEVLESGLVSANVMETKLKTV